jgi:ATP-binding protein involved in chromosome partitioning
MITEEQVLQKLSRIQDPDLGQDIVKLGFVRDITIAPVSGGTRIALRINLTTPACPVKDQMRTQAETLLKELPGVTAVEVTMTADVRKAIPGAGERRAVPGVRNLIAVGSGKGGVGKSTVTCNLAAGLAATGARVGLLDADIYGPSIPIMMRGGRAIRAVGNRIEPAEAHGVKLMSMGYLAEGDKPLIWRGPMAHKALEQCLFDVNWGELDYLFVDLPPGTGDVHLTLAQSTALAGGIIVSTPQDVGLTIARKTLRMFQQTGVRILGILENMSFFTCSNCGSREHLFGHGTVASAAAALEIPYLGEVPLESVVREAADDGMPVILKHPRSASAVAFNELIGKVAQQVSVASFSPAAC